MHIPDDWLTDLPGIKSSLQIREELAADGKPVILSFSRGKDSIAAWLAMLDAGIEVLPFYMYNPPGLQFVEDSLKYFEDFFGTHIIRYPHQSLFTFLAGYTDQPPTNINLIIKTQLQSLGDAYQTVNAWARMDYNQPDAWVADGVRAADSQNRRAAILNHGMAKERTKQVNIIGDWKIKAVRERINAAGIKWPIDYEIWGNTFDGTDKRFVEPLKKHLPEDYERLKLWFPMVDADIMRWEHKDA